MDENELDKLTGIFYNEAPYDYVLTINSKKRKRLRGVCIYALKACVVFAPESYNEALFTMLHEIAHARVQHKTHSETWEKEFVQLLRKYNFPRYQAAAMAPSSPNMRKWIEE